MGAAYLPPPMAQHLRGYVRRDRRRGWYRWVWEVRDLESGRVVADGGEFSLPVAMTECRRCVVAARNWWFWGGGVALSDPDDGTTVA